MLTATIAFVNELIGTFLLVLLGDGVCCNISLNKSGMKGGNTVHIAIGWGLAVLLPAFVFGASTGAHFNPSVTIALAAAGKMGWDLVPAYIAGQMIGGFLGAAFLIVLYHNQLAATPDAAVKRGCFCTGGGESTALNMLSEFTCGFCLLFFICGIPAVSNGVNFIFVWGIIMSIGFSFGGLTGYAMNAARDTAPRLAYALFCPGERDAQWGYAWIPALCPIVGGVCGALVASNLTLSF